jgi:hypothetical protein
MAKSKKPYIKIEKIECPKCQSELEISVFRTKVNDPEPSEYEIKTEVRVIKQGKLFEQKKI